MKIEIQDVTKTFKRTRALSDVSKVIKTGTVGAVIGLNGAGKTTLLRLLAGPGMNGLEQFLSEMNNQN